MTSRGRCAVVLRHGRWSSRAVGTDGGRSGRAVQAAGACGRAVRRIAGSVSFVEIVDHYTVYRYIYIYILEELVARVKNHVFGLGFPMKSSGRGTPPEDWDVLGINSAAAGNPRSVLRT